MSVRTDIEEIDSFCVPSGDFRGVSDADELYKMADQDYSSMHSFVVGVERYINIFEEAVLQLQAILFETKVKDIEQSLEEFQIKEDAVMVILPKVRNCENRMKSYMKEPQLQNDNRYKILQENSVRINLSISSMLQKFSDLQKMTNTIRKLVKQHFQILNNPIVSDCLPGSENHPPVPLQLNEPEGPNHGDYLLSSISPSPKSTPEAPPQDGDSCSDTITGSSDDIQLASQHRKNQDKESTSPLLPAFEPEEHDAICPPNLDNRDE